MNFVDREKQIEKFWDDNHIFEKSMEEREGCPDYIFYDGPPTANGKPHIGHVLTRVIKDMIPYIPHSPWHIPSHEENSSFPNKVYPASLGLYVPPLMLSYELQKFRHGVHFHD